MRRLLKFALLLLALTGLAGCSGTRLAYNHADTLVRWMADDYFALDGAQQEDFNERLVRFHAWHRSDELPRYSALMASAAGKLARGLTQPELSWAWDSVVARYRSMAAQAAPDLAPVLTTLTPAQFQRLEQKFAESNAEYARKHLSGGEAEQRERRDKRNLELMREWFGDLSGEQESEGESAYELADTFCEQARVRVDELFERLWHNTDDIDRRVAARTLDGRYVFLEDGIIDQSEGTGPWIAAWTPGESELPNVARSYR